MRQLHWTLLIGMLLFTGCTVLPKQEPTSEFKMDQAMSVPEIPKAPPLTDPGEPQKEFQQEVATDSVNL